MNKDIKKKIVENLKTSFENSEGVIVTHYLGLNNSELTDLRNRVKEVGSKFCVTKNSLAKLATKATNYESLNNFFSGPVALVFSKNPLTAIKVIKKYCDENEKLKFISASLENSLIEFEEFEKLSKLPALEELRAMIAGYMTTPHQQLVNVINAGGTELVGVLENYSMKTN